MKSGFYLYTDLSFAEGGADSRLVGQLITAGSCVRPALGLGLIAQQGFHFQHSHSVFMSYTPEAHCLLNFRFIEEIP